MRRLGQDRSGSLSQNAVAEVRRVRSSICLYQSVSGALNDPGMCVGKSLRTTDREVVPKIRQKSTSRCRMLFTIDGRCQLKHVTRATRRTTGRLAIIADLSASYA
jgi:hypothetical protein